MSSGPSFPRLGRVPGRFGWLVAGLCLLTAVVAARLSLSDAAPFVQMPAGPWWVAAMAALVSAAFAVLAPRTLRNSRVVAVCAVALSGLVLSATALRLPHTLLYLAVWTGAQLFGAGAPFGDEPRWLLHSFHLLALSSSMGVAAWSVVVSRRLRGVCLRCGRREARSYRGRDRRALLRRLSAITIASSVPYALLKVMWGLGIRVGVAEGTFSGYGLWSPGFGDTALLVALGVLVSLAMALPVRQLVARAVLAVIAGAGAAMLVPVGMLGTLGVLLLPVGLEPIPVSDAFAVWVGAVVYPGFLAWGLLLTTQTRTYWQETRPDCRRHDPDARAKERTSGMPWLRLACGYGVIAAVAPYATLKVLWLTGHMVGIPASSAAREPAFIVANSMTLCIDILACLLAVALTHSWGRRVPAWLVLLPAWVGTGLLGPAAVQVVVGGVYTWIADGQLVKLDGGLVNNETYTIVYLSLLLQGILLAGAFWFHARDRWPLPLSAAPRREPGAVGVLDRLLATGAASVLAAVGLASIVAAVTTPTLWRTEWLATIRIGHAVDGAFALAGAVGVVALVGARARRRDPIPVRLMVTATWLGAGSAFSWGLFRTVALVADAPLTDAVSPARGLSSLTAMLGGLVLAISVLSIVVRHAEQPDPLTTGASNGPSTAAMAAHGSVPTNRTYPPERTTPK